MATVDAALLLLLCPQDDLLNTNTKKLRKRNINKRVRWAYKDD